ncbi:hypothetical protein M409DRAFT_26009 [Zasmidium cellare ATCC 36951]|uniref:FAD-binding domain-containing protein n=1 Tax=Zasmidium cellare ATCC 36951 TaxID=1080233 RepID=A0A6A6CDV8_ZASCE|nr:uncharacterized protein M409DRAFT_26009 [Zasmidium cellare ATCC 36951]KAF2163829.1 hypothetical protein M409DRAFT_26009 [Zasmidium cellare ATCC 36951]
MAAKTNEEAIEEVPVLIVGGSLVGLTLAALLAKYGIKCMVVEKHSSTAIHPRATVMMPRTMQAFKELGLYEIMKEESLKYYDERTCIITTESLAGKLLHKWLEDVNEGIENVSATRRVFLTQQALEPLLRSKAKALGASLHFSTEVVSLTQDSNSVTATLRNRDSDTTYQIRSKYLIGADGFRSTTRSLLGIQTQGPGLLSRALTIYFEILDKEKLAKLANAHYSGVIYVANEVVRCFFRFDRDKKESFLVINSAGEQGSEESRFPADTASMEKANEYLRAAIGDETIEFKIHQLTTWEAIADMPERLREGRVLLAGDAAHRMPPSGGFGGNTGVQDAHNLAWKLAYVLKGKAGPELLETYEEERYPVAKHTVENALAHYVHRTEPILSHLVDEFNVKESPVEHLELAYRYHSKALFTNGPLDASNITEDPATSIAAPGSVAHHVLVNTFDGQKNIAISEFFGESFVLFVGPKGGPWIDGMKTLGKCFKTVQLAFNSDNAFARRYDVLEDGAVLVRPDGFVAWSCRSVVGERVQDAGALLEQTKKQVLCL